MSWDTTVSVQYLCEGYVSRPAEDTNFIGYFHWIIESAGPQKTDISVRSLQQAFLQYGKAKTFKNPARGEVLRGASGFSPNQKR